MPRRWGQVAPCALAVVLLGGACGPVVEDVDLDRTGLGSRFSRRGAIVYRNEPLYELVQSLEHCFDTHLSIEEHPRRKEKATPRKVDVRFTQPGMPVWKAWHLSEIRLEKTTTLRQALDAFCKACDGLYTYRLVHGQICLIPVSEAGNPTPSVMDRKLTFAVKKATTEEALNQLFAAYNAQYPKEELKWVTSADQVGWRMPEPYYTGSGISLNLSDVTLREAICRVFDSSPIWLSYRYLRTSSFVLVITNYKLPNEMLKNRE